MHLLSKDEINYEHFEEIKDPVKEHWGQQNNNARIWGILIALFNLVYSLGALFSPMNENHFKINIAYTCMSFSSLILFVVSFKMKNFNYNFAALIIVTCRNITRLFDIEGSF